jgi:hypothetical protein
VGVTLTPDGVAEIVAVALSVGVAVGSSTDNKPIAAGRSAALSTPSIFASLVLAHRLPSNKASTSAARSALRFSRPSQSASPVRLDSGRAGAAAYNK